MANLRLTLSGTALVHNWQSLARRAGLPPAAAGAAVKADGYGLGAAEVASRLSAAGCRSFAVSTWAEAESLGRPPGEATVLVLHGFLADDAATAAALAWARPVLNTPGQVAAWAAAFPGRPADLMVDTGMNRLGLGEADLAAALAGLAVETVHSHLAAADEPDHPLNRTQLDRFRALAAATPGVRHVLANSAGACLGPAYAFDGARLGLGVYGGSPAPGEAMRPVVAIEARVLQVTEVPEGASVGYGATWVAARPARIATLNLGYADGLPRALAPHLAFAAAGRACPAVGRLSMDLTSIDVTGHDVREGDWLPLSFDLPALAQASGIAQYELLVALSRRYERRWT